MRGEEKREEKRREERDAMTGGKRRGDERLLGHLHKWIRFINIGLLTY